MKQAKSLLTYAAVAAVFLSSCKDEEVMEADKTEIPAKFSAYTPVQNKTNLEDNGVALMNDMSDLRDAKGTEASSSFISFMSQAQAVPGNARITVAARALANYREGKGSVHDVFTSMRQQQEEPQSLQEVYNTYLGVYEWNSQIQDWDYKKEGDKIVFKFPATAGSSSNNASYIVHSYKGVMVSNALNADYKGDYPTQLIAELQVEGKKEIEYRFNATYNDKGEPTQVSSSLSVGAFIFAVSAENKIETVGVEYSLKKGEKNLIMFGANAKGTFTAEQINKVEHDENSNAGDVAQEVRAYFQLMDIRIAGNVNVEQYSDGEKAIYAGSESNPEFDYNQAVEKTAALLNENFDLAVLYASSKEKIAETEVYTYTDYYEYEYPVYDENGYVVGYETEKVAYTDMDIRMIFADGSKSDLETYFSDGFDNLEAEISKFIASME